MNFDLRIKKRVLFLQIPGYGLHDRNSASIHGKTSIVPSVLGSLSLEINRRKHEADQCRDNFTFTF